MTYSHFWEAPSRYWKPRVRELEEWEMEAIMVRLHVVYSYTT